MIEAVFCSHTSLQYCPSDSNHHLPVYCCVFVLLFLFYLFKCISIVINICWFNLLINYCLIVNFIRKCRPLNHFPQFSLDQGYLPLILSSINLRLQYFPYHLLSSDLFESLIHTGFKFDPLNSNHHFFQRPIRMNLNFDWTYGWMTKINTSTTLATVF